MIKTSSLFAVFLAAPSMAIATSCSAPLSVQSDHAIPSLADVVKESSQGSYVVCKQNGVVSFVGQSAGSINVSAQHVIYRDKTTQDLVFIQNMGGQCRVSRHPESSLGSPQTEPVTPAAATPKAS